MRPGTAVNAGDLIARVNPAPYEQTLAVAQLQLAQAADTAARAQYKYEKALDRHWEPPEVVEAYRLEAAYAADTQQVAQAAYDAMLNQRWAVGQQIAAQQTGVERATVIEEDLSMAWLWGMRWWRWGTGRGRQWMQTSVIWAQIWCRSTSKKRSIRVKWCRSANIVL